MHTREVEELDKEIVTKIDAIVLAAGSSTRMPSANKLLLDTLGELMIQKVISQLTNSQINNLIVVIGYEHEQIIDALKDYPDIKFIYNAAFKKGQSFSIKAAMSMVAEDSDAFMVCLGDMPMISTDDYNLMIDEYDAISQNISRPIIRPIYKESIGHPVIFHKSYQDDVLRLASGDDCREVIKSNADNYFKIEVNSINYFFDIDNDHDYQRLIRYLEK